MGTALTPISEAELRDAVAGAASDHAPLRIFGHDSKSGLGNAIAGMALDLSHLSGIVSYQPQELVLSARAGTPMSEIGNALREQRQHLAFEPPDWGPLFGAVAGRGTIGGILSCNAAGPRRLRAGAARDHFLGFTAINGRGEIFKAGGRVVKNVTGYDLPKLMAGAYGTLGVMSEVTVKTLPAPPDSATLIVHDLGDMDALRALRIAAASTLELSGLAHLPPGIAGPRAQTLFRLEGPHTAVTERHGRLKTLLQAFGNGETPGSEAASAVWRRVRDVDFFVHDAQPLWRISVPPASGADVAARIAAEKYYFDWAGGLIWLLSDNALLVRDMVAATGGYATLFRAPDAMRRATPALHPQPGPLAALQQRVRENFDPHGIFNPGRV